MLSPAVTPSSNLKPRSPRMHPFRKLREGGPMTRRRWLCFNADIVMHTPILIKPIVCRELVSFAVSISSQSRDDPGKYIFEGKIDARTTLLRWQGTVEGHKIESLELLIDDENGLLLERTIAYRPFPALKIFRDRLFALNADKVPDDVWDYPKTAET
jgi:hypothetical protein